MVYGDVHMFHIMAIYTVWHVCLPIYYIGDSSQYDLKLIPNSIYIKDIIYMI